MSMGSLPAAAPRPCAGSPPSFRTMAATSSMGNTTPVSLFAHSAHDRGAEVQRLAELRKVDLARPNPPPARSGLVLLGQEAHG